VFEGARRGGGTRRPVSRVLCLPEGSDDHSSGPPIAGRFSRPTRIPEAPATAPPAKTQSAWGGHEDPYLVLLQAGLAMPSRSPGPRWALTPPFHPYPPSPRLRRAVCFLWRYPWGHPRRALPAALSPWSPDFPPPPRGGSDRPAVWPAAEGVQQNCRGQPAASLSRAISRARVSPSAMPSTRSWRQWRWKPRTIVAVPAS